jgi:hypothetical protein
MITKKNIVYLLVASVCVILLFVYFFSPDTVSEKIQQSAQQPDEGVSVTVPAAGLAVPAGGVELPEPAAVEFTEEKPILGQFMRIREIRESDGSGGEGAIRNLEFVFREGILPGKLFPDNRQVILKYDQLARNMVGDGAASVFFLYQVVSRDTNGDGMLSDLDAITVGVSRPTGQEYMVLVTNVDEVLGYEDVPEDADTLSLSVRIGEEVVTSVYALSITGQ